MYQKIYDDGFVRVFNTSKGPHIYMGEVRVHHWMAGILMLGVGLIGCLFDKSKRRRPWYILSILIGGLCVLDDLLDLLSFLEGE